MHSASSQEDAGPRAGPLWETTKKNGRQINAQDCDSFLITQYVFHDTGNYVM